MKLSRLFVCADDYGQNKSISEGISKLAHEHRINAVSLLVNGDYWNNLPQDSLLGLHFNLTWGKAISREWKETCGETFPSLSCLLVMLHSRRVERVVIEAELLAQWMRFIEMTGKEPDFIDGHQHVHQYLLVRDVLCLFLKRNDFQGWCRVSSNKGEFSGLKSLLISLLGSEYLRNDLKRINVQFNPSFAGFYPLKNVKYYRDYFRKFLFNTKPGGLIMCHPGFLSLDVTDPLNLYRHYEYNYLASDDYWDDLQEAGFAQ